MELQGRFVFGHTVEALFHRALAGRIAPSCASSLRKAGLDLQAPLEAAYPLAKWQEWLQIGVGSLFPDKPLEEAHRLLGEELVEGYQNTALGQSLFALLNLIGPHKAIARLARNFQSGNSYTKVKIERTGPTRYEVWMNEVTPYPQFVQGILLAALRVLVQGASRVELISRGDDGVVYEVEWGLPGVSLKRSGESAAPGPRH